MFRKLSIGIARSLGGFSEKIGIYIAKSGLLGINIGLSLDWRAVVVISLHYLDL